MSAEVRSERFDLGLARLGSVGKWLLPAFAMLALSSFVTTTCAAGRTVTITTNAPGASIQIDGRAGTNVNEATVVFDRLPFGTRSVSVAEQDYVGLASEIEVGLFRATTYHFDLERRLLQLEVATVPGASVVLGGLPLGTADDMGRLTRSDVPSGRYVLVVQRDGYHPYQSDVTVREPNTKLSARLRMTEEMSRRLAEQRQQANDFVREARALFGRRAYSQALDAVARSLELDPSNTPALQLREQITQTLKILQ